MCGRYSLFEDPSRLADILHVRVEEVLEPRFNIAPTQEAPIVTPDAEHERALKMARWGLLPHWADPSTFKATLINARSETAADKPSFRDAFRKGRCVVPASGFFEWRKEEDGPKQPYFIRRRDGEPLLFAGLSGYNVKGPEPIRSFTILTSRPNLLMEYLHDRQPVILLPEQVADWLDTSARSAEQLAPLMEPNDPAELEAVPVSRTVNSPTNDRPEVLEPTGPAVTIDASSSSATAPA
jgi:putative SOS response-associated peptidase YedK